MQEKTIHFAPCPCGNHYGNSTSNPDEVTCGECVPVAAKHKRGAALQAYEQTEIKYRAASAAYARAEEARGAACFAMNDAARELRAARKVVLDLLPDVSS